jgi:hypothetical protein
VPGSQSGELVESLNPRYFDNPALLTDAQPSGVQSAILTSGQNLVNVDFANYMYVSIDGRKYHDIDANGQRDVGEEYLDGWTIELRTAGGALIESVVTSSIDLNNNETIEPETEAGWYFFDNVVPSSRSINEVTQDGWVRSEPSTGGVSELAFQLDNQFEFYFTGNLYENAYNANENGFDRLQKSTAGSSFCPTANSIDGRKSPAPRREP